MIDLKGKPFYLSDEDIKWVEETRDAMDLDTKIGQLFCLLIEEEDLSGLEQRLQAIKLKPGGYMSRPFAGAVIQRSYGLLQVKAEIPLLLAANLEKGGDGLALDGTCFGSQMQVAATADENVAYRFGLVCGREAAAVGCNWTFSPVIDIDFNYRNPITNTRTYGSDPQMVLRMARAYMRGVQESGLAVTLKHWPGDGVDDRDQHLLTSVNTLTTDQWDQTYGTVYKEMIAAGAQTVMSAQIMLPAYSQKFQPGLDPAAILPAALAAELNIKLLREQLGFNGLVVTDASTMTGFMAALSRKQAVPAAIAAGNDLFLFARNLPEDFEFMKAGVRDGIISGARLEEAVTRILALKASLRLHHRQATGTLVPDASAVAALANPEHREWAQECADKAICLVKDTQKLLPLTVERHCRILLYVLGDVGGYHDYSSGHHVKLQSLLEEAGFVVTKFDSAHVDMELLNRPLEQWQAQYDLLFYFASLKTASNQTVVRINWAQPMGADAPRLIQEIPTLFVSVDNPYHLQDVPRMKTFINAYTGSEIVIAALVEKLLGKSEFKGKSPSDPFCSYWDARF
jgi:beta-N-acetylhexosaminidase